MKNKIKLLLLYLLVYSSNKPKLASLAYLINNNTSVKGIEKNWSKLIKNKLSYIT